MPRDTDTIVAVASPPGRGAEAIIRLSGEKALGIADALFHSPHKLRDQPAFRVVQGEIRLDSMPPLPAHAYIMRAPATYTREDAAELHLPSSAPILQAVMNAAMRAGARAAEPGEFTERAFLNGRINLAQAEAVLRVVNAVHRTELHNALAQLRGFAHHEILSLRNRAVELMSLLELNIDFSDQEIVPVAPAEIRRRIAEIMEDVDAIRRRASRLIPAEGIPVALYGPANAGKSTLFNALAGAEKAIVSHLPGTTRDYLHAEIEMDGVLLRLIDTAGIRETADIVERMAQARSREQASAAGVLVHVLDIREAATPSGDRPPDVIALNKCDLAGADARAHCSPEGWPCPAVRISAKKGDGLAELRHAILQAVELQVSGGHAFVPNLRQTACLEKARESLEAAIGTEGDELVAFELRRAADSLGEIIGEVAPQDLLERIFSQFCIGK